MIVSECNLYITIGILLLSKCMNPTNIVNAYFGSLKIVFSAAAVNGEKAVHYSHPYPFHSRHIPEWFIQALSCKDLPSFVSVCMWEGQGQAEVSFANVDAIY